MRRDREGIALILVVSILTVVAISVVSFIFTMRLENRAAANYLWQKKARYIAEAGVAHARAVLREDKEKGFIDTYEDLWRSAFSGSDIDNSDDQKEDSRWIEVSSEGKVIGRYAVLIEDEAAKININTAGFHNESVLKATEGATPFEVSLKDFLLAKNISSAESLAGSIIDYRWGKDKAPGEKNKDDNLNSVFLAYEGIDNDADGEIDEAREGTDEPQEFAPHHPYGDDKPFLAAEEIRGVPAVSSGVYNEIKPEITVYSQTASVDRNKDLQWDINSVDAQQLLDIFLESGVSHPWRKSVNLVDFVDSDFAQSVVVKSTLPLYTGNQGPRGDWFWAGDHYENKTFGGAAGNWSWWGIAAGTYYVVFYGARSGQDVGDVTIDGFTHQRMDSGESFLGPVTITEEAHPLFPQGGIGCLRFAIQNNEELGRTCFLKYIELVSAEGKVLAEIQEIRGAEGIRINEIMAKPTVDVATSVAQYPGGDWQWKDGYYENPVSAGGVKGQGSWIWQNIPSGEYYLTVFAASEGQIVGDVLADGAIQENMRSGERFTQHKTVTVSGEKFRIDIRNNLSEGSCFFKSALLSQQPDAEYIELVNLTADEVSLGGWSLEASGSDGWPGTIPLGAVIAAGGYLVLAVDKEDSSAGINGNGISFEDVWGKLPAAQLDFSRSVTGYSDMLEDEPAGGKGRIVLRDERGNVVDSQEYSSSQIVPYISLEKGDPTYLGAADEVWFKSSDLSGATPAKKNNNPGIIEIKEGQTIEHSLDEVKLKNNPLANLGEISQVPSGESWQKIGLEGLMNAADSLTVYSLRLEAEGYKKEGGWSEQLRPPPRTSWFVSENEGETGTWLWDEKARIPNGVYTLSLYGENAQGLAVSLHLADGSWTAFTPALIPGPSNGVCFGRIEVGAESPGSLPADKIELQIKNASAANTAHFDYILLSPLPYVAGKLNINTASQEALSALPKIDSATAQRIIQARPLGNKESKGRGIGDILFGDILAGDEAEKLAKFSACSNLITVRSDSFQIIATAQALRNGRVMAEKRIRAIIER